MLQRSVGQPSHEAPHSLHLPFAYSSIAVMLALRRTRLHSHMTCSHSCTHPLTHSLPISPPPSLTHSLTPSLTHSPALLHSHHRSRAERASHPQSRSPSLQQSLQRSLQRPLRRVSATMRCSAALGLQVPAAEAVNRSSVAPIVPLVLNPTISVRSAHGGTQGVGVHGVLSV